MTGCRRTEIAELTWADIDLAERTIVIPAARYKTGRAHQVPLSRQAQALLEAMPRFSGPFVFSAAGGERPLSAFNWFKDKIDSLLDPPVEYALHDLRRTVRTGMARLRVPPHIAERCLGHAQRGIERHYDQHSYADEKRQALQSWADHIARLIDGEAAGKVVALRG